MAIAPKTAVESPKPSLATVSEPFSSASCVPIGGLVSDLTAPTEVPVLVSGTTVAAMTESAARPTRRDLTTGTSGRRE